MTVVLLAGGPGTRLHPFTHTTPKPLLDLGDVPILGMQLALCARHGLTDVVLNIHHLAARVPEVLGDGGRWGVNLRYSVEETPLGTAGPVALAADLLDGGPHVVFNGDILTDLDLTALLEAHRKSGAAVTLTCTEVKDPTAFGLVLADADGRVSRFLEKPTRDEARVLVDRFWVNAGTYVIDDAVIRRMPQGRPYSFERELFPSLLAEGVPMHRFESAAYWRDCGTPESWRHAVRDILEERLAPPDHWQRELRDGHVVWSGGSVTWGEGARVEGGPVFLGAGTRLGAGVRLGRHVVLGPDVTVGASSRLVEVQLGRRARVGEGARLTSVIAGDDCVVESECTVQADALLASGTVLARGTRIG